MSIFIPIYTHLSICTYIDSHDSVLDVSPRNPYLIIYTLYTISHTFILFYYYRFYFLQIFLLYGLVWPDICGWDERSFMIIAWGLCAITTIMTDAMPTQRLHNLIGTGVGSALLIVIFLTICVYREWFIDLHFNKYTIVSADFDVKEQFLSRVATLGLFALKFLKTAVFSPDALMLINGTITRSDFVNKYQPVVNDIDLATVGEANQPPEDEAGLSWGQRVWRKLVFYLGD